MTGIDMAFTGKILLFKSISAQSMETYTDFHLSLPTQHSRKAWIC
jgi:hypothetical protein